MSKGETTPDRDLEGRAYGTGQRAGWYAAYAKWIPEAISNGSTQVNDAFRAGYLAAVRDMMELQNER